jgi:hypothetical protein
MNLMTEEMKQRVWEQIQLKSAEPFTDKEVENLVVMIRSAALVKAMGALWAQAETIPRSLCDIDLDAGGGVATAIKLQGRRQGIIFAIEGLLSLATTDEEGEGGEEQ